MISTKERLFNFKRLWYYKINIKYPHVGLCRLHEDIHLRKGGDFKDEYDFTDAGTPAEYYNIIQ